MSVDGQKRCPELRNVGDGALHRIADVEELGIEEDLFLRAREFADEGQSVIFGIGRQDQLEADLVETDFVSERSDKTARLIHRWQIQGNDKPVARVADRVRGHGLPTFAKGCLWNGRVGQDSLPGVRPCGR